MIDIRDHGGSFGGDITVNALKRSGIGTEQLAVNAEPTQYTNEGIFPLPNGNNVKMRFVSSGNWNLDLLSPTFALIRTVNVGDLRTADIKVTDDGHIIVYSQNDNTFRCYNQELSLRWSYLMQVAGGGYGLRATAINKNVFMYINLNLAVFINILTGSQLKTINLELNSAFHPCAFTDDMIYYCPYYNQIRAHRYNDGVLVGSYTDPNNKSVYGLETKKGKVVAMYSDGWNNNLWLASFNSTLSLERGGTNTVALGSLNIDNGSTALNRFRKVKEVIYMFAGYRLFVVNSAGSVLMTIDATSLVNPNSGGNPYMCYTNGTLAVTMQGNRTFRTVRFKVIRD